MIGCKMGGDSRHDVHMKRYAHLLTRGWFGTQCGAGAVYTVDAMSLSREPEAKAFRLIEGARLFFLSAGTP